MFSIFLFLGDEIVGLELHVIHLHKPLYPRDVKALGILRWKKVC
jgi:hypothetical protein